MSEVMDSLGNQSTDQDVFLSCTRCGAKFHIHNILQCPECGGILLVGYSEGYFNTQNSQSSTDLDSMWRYSNFLPPIQESNRISVGEGITPLRLSRKPKNPDTRLFFKDETKNPTGSFKDRPVSLCISMAKYLGCERIVIASSGNGAASAACYASLAGLENAIFVPAHTPFTKVAQTIAYGGNIKRIEGDFSKSYDQAVIEAKNDKTMNITTTYLNPFGVEGDKTIAFEIFDSLSKNPDFIFIPVGAGPILYGIYKGFKEISDIHPNFKIPRLVAVQASGCSPIVDAIHNSHPVIHACNPNTIASAICDPLLGYEQEGDLTIQAIKASDGIGVVVDDEQIINAGLELARSEGLYVEPSAAVSYAGYLKILGEHQINPMGTVVCVLTGNGLKDSSGYFHKQLGSSFSEENIKAEGDYILC